MDVYAGTSGYSYPEWKGTFYPPKLPANRMLGYYAERFRAVEINNTFYRPPTAQLLKSWAGRVPAAFRFALKAPQEITHVRRLRDACGPVTEFVQTAETLGDRLGPVLFQLPPTLARDVGLLEEFLGRMPACRAAFEFRHASWFAEDVFELLRDHQAALCVADADDGPEVPFVPTADWGYVRLRRPGYDDAALRGWVNRLRAAGWRECHVYFKHEDAGTGPRLAARLLELLAADGATRRRAA